MQYIDTYSQIKEGKRFSGRQYLRNIALSALAWVDQRSGIESYLGMPRVQFLYVHHIFKDEEVAFERLINKLSKNHHFISYSRAVEFILNRKIDKPYLVISSDDGFRNNLRAAEIMNKYGISGCFFINPSIIDLKDEGAIKIFCRQRLNFPPVEFLTWQEVERLQKWGHEIGSHTMNHINLANSTEQEIQYELGASYNVIRQRCGDTIHFAFPYGRFFHFSEAARKIVFEIGFASCASAERGCHINHPSFLSKSELCILRDHIVLDWSIDHILHFMANNSKKVNYNSNLFPYSTQ